MWNEFAPLEKEVMRIKAEQKIRKDEMDLHLKAQHKEREEAILVEENMDDNVRLRLKLGRD